MTTPEILQLLESLGSPATKKVLMKHGIPEPLYAVKIEELKKIQKKTKQNHALSLELYATGIYDAMYLAGIIAEPMKMTEAELQNWVSLAKAPVIYETIVAGVAAESPFGLKLALQWIDSEHAGIRTCGWSVLSFLVSIKPDEELDMDLLKKLMRRVAENIQTSPNRVKMTMNSFIISTGVYVTALNGLAKETADKIGKVNVDMGDTACKVPSAREYIEKAESKNGLGKKRTYTIC